MPTVQQDEQSQHTDICATNLASTVSTLLLLATVAFYVFYQRFNLNRKSKLRAIQEVDVRRRLRRSLRDLCTSEREKPLASGLFERHMFLRRDAAPPRTPFRNRLAGALLSLRSWVSECRRLIV